MNSVLSHSLNDDGAVFGLDIFKNNGGCRRRTISEAITFSDDEHVIVLPVGRADYHHELDNK